MAFEPKDMSGSVFVNTRKESDNHPDRTGSAMIDGVEYWVNGWLKKTKEGDPWLSLSFKRKDQKAERSTSGMRRSRDDTRTDGRQDDDRDSIPF